MKPIRLFGLTSLLAFLTGCAGHRMPEPAGPHPDEPHVSWLIQAGTADDPEQITVCASEPRSDCVVGASRPDKPFFVSVHLYLHPTPTQTTYTGRMRVGFFGSAQSAHETKVDRTVAPGEEPGSVLVYDRLPTQPGTYPFEVDLVATVQESTDGRAIRDMANVIVK